MTRLLGAWRSARMAAANLVVLSSSPLHDVLQSTPPSKACAAMSSSPGLPSPSIFFLKGRPQLGTASRGSLIRNDAVAGFRSASTLLQQSQANSTSKFAASPGANSVSKGELGNNAIREPVADERRIQAGPKGKGALADAPRQRKAPAAKKPLAEIAAAVVIESSPIIVTKKTSSAKVKEPAQTKIKKGKVTKAATAGSKRKDGIKARATEAEDDNGVLARKGSTSSAESDHKNELAGNVHGPVLREGQNPLSENISVPLGLTEATKRRKAWTPVKDTSDGFTIIDSAEATPVGKYVSTAREPQPRNFANLLGDYSLPQPVTTATTKPAITRTSSGEALTKRRKVEVSWENPLQ